MDGNGTPQLPSMANGRVLVNLHVRLATGSYTKVQEAIQNHNKVVIQQHGKRYPKLRFTTLVRSLVGSWARDEI